jgi:hypothetical protein
MEFVAGAFELNGMFLFGYNLCVCVCVCVFFFPMSNGLGRVGQDLKERAHEWV